VLLAHRALPAAAMTTAVSSGVLDPQVIEIEARRQASGQATAPASCPCPPSATRPPASPRSPPGNTPPHLAYLAEILAAEPIRA
jgi:hypothetical protein